MIHVIDLGGHFAHEHRRYLENGRGYQDGRKFGSIFIARTDLLAF